MDTWVASTFVGFLFFGVFKIFIYLFGPRQVLVAALGIFVAMCGIFLVVGGRALSCWHVESSSLTRGRTQGLCIGSVES